MSDCCKGLHPLLIVRFARDSVQVHVIFIARAMPNPTKIDTTKKPSEVVVVSEDELDNDNSDGPLDFEKILKFEVGEFGPYQIFAGITMGFVSAFASFMVLNFLFISAVPDHR